MVFTAIQANLVLKYYLKKPKKTKKKNKKTQTTQKSKNGSFSTLQGLLLFFSSWILAIFSKKSLKQLHFVANVPDKTPLPTVVSSEYTDLGLWPQFLAVPGSGGLRSLCLSLQVLRKNLEYSCFTFQGLVSVYLHLNTYELNQYNSKEGHRAIIKMSFLRPLQWL